MLLGIIIALIWDTATDNKNNTTVKERNENKNNQCKSL